MALSKSLFNLLGSYFEQLHYYPLRTKSVSSCTIAVLGNITSQYLSGTKVIDQDSVFAFGLFGLIFGGSVPHFFYKGLDAVISRDAHNFYIKQLVVERLLYTPLYQALSLYMLSRLEGRSHKDALRQLLKMYWPILKANWMWLTCLQYLNLRFVPPMLRVLVVNVISFFWVVYLAKMRRQCRDQCDNRQ